MKRERIEALWQDKMAGELSPAEAEELEKYLKQHPSVASEMKELEQTWELFDEIQRPTPSTQMDARFEDMLVAYQESKNRRSWLTLPVSVQEWFSQSWQVGLACLVLGLFVGWWLLPSQSQTQSIGELSDEIQTMKEMMMLTLIEQPKAQERIRAVNLAADLPNADEKVIQALLMTLTNDNNLNVRLAALETLITYADLPEVRAALIDALETQDSPIMQVAIADALVAIQERSSVDAMQQLRESVEDDFVKSKLDESIQTLTNI